MARVWKAVVASTSLCGDTVGILGCLGGSGAGPRGGGKGRLPPALPYPLGSFVHRHTALVGLLRVTQDRTSSQVLAGWLLSSGETWVVATLHMCGPSPVPFPGPLSCCPSEAVQLCHPQGAWLGGS